MFLKKNERLVAAGQMPIRAPDGKQLAAVPVYRIVPADSSSGGVISKSERLVAVGSTERKEAAEERYNALIAGEIPPESRATTLYIKEPADGSSGGSGLTEGEQRALNPLIADLLNSFSAAMQERETLELQGKVKRQ